MPGRLATDVWIPADNQEDEYCQNQTEDNERDEDLEIWVVLRIQDLGPGTTEHCICVRFNDPET